MKDTCFDIIHVIENSETAKAVSNGLQYILHLRDEI